MTIYLDAVWLLNFFLDWMILLLVQSITRNNAQKWRVLLGAMVASLLVPIALFAPESFVITTFGKALYSLVIVLAAFGFINFRQFVHHLLSFYFVSFALGGGLIAIHFFLGNQLSVNNGGILTFQTGYGDQLSWLFVLFGFPFIWWFTKSRMDKQALETFRYDQLYQVTIRIKGKSFSTMGYMDSGNQLVDPISRKPVIICDQTFMSNWFTREEWNQLQHAQEHLSFESLPDSIGDAIQIVPYQGVDGNRTFMIVLKPDELLVNDENNQLTIKKVLVGLQFGDLAPDGSYHCLLHPTIYKQSVATSA
ncbi:sigma-E processing peptidase SpoIIGA [Aquibacillus sediminis]|uniref:sigma-E processing peptidase SpoIIGA n=1 Tax=Aquibacillus sediminis TaxID=2574734 RepID=UPI00110801EA|nr:sigma-E processing peptidase SpoIIGA [Aquibacillus sediminis]